jgi:hypothetical protein
MLSAANHLQLSQVQAKSRFFASLRMTCFTSFGNAALGRHLKGGETRRIVLGYLVPLLPVLELCGSIGTLRGGRVLPAAEESPVITAWGSRRMVYYPSPRRVFVYTELGGNCVFAYTLSAPGGAISRENCK